MQCPRCGYEKSELDAECLRCQRGGASVLSPPAAPDPPPIMAEPATEKECPRCGKATRADAPACDKCGYQYRPEDSPAERYQARLAEEARLSPPAGSALRRTVSPYLSWSVIGVCLLLMAGGAWLMLTASLPGGDASDAGDAVAVRAHRPRPAPGTKPVLYQVSGTAARAMIAYRGADGSAVAPKDPVALPWTQTVDMKPGASLSLSAEPAGGGTVTCAISVGGTLRKQAAKPGSDGLTIVSDTL